MSIYLEMSSIMTTVTRLAYWVLDRSHRFSDKCAKLIEDNDRRPAVRDRLQWAETIYQDARHVIAEGDWETAEMDITADENALLFGGDVPGSEFRYVERQARPLPTWALPPIEPDIAFGTHRPNHVRDRLPARVADFQTA